MSSNNPINQSRLELRKNVSELVVCYFEKLKKFLNEYSVDEIKSVDFSEPDRLNYVIKLLKEGETNWITTHYQREDGVFGKIIANLTNKQFNRFVSTLNETRYRIKAIDFCIAYQQGDTNSIKRVINYVKTQFDNKNDTHAQAVRTFLDKREAATTPNYLKFCAAVGSKLDDDEGPLYLQDVSARLGEHTVTQPVTFDSFDDYLDVMNDGYPLCLSSYQHVMQRLRNIEQRLDIKKTPENIVSNISNRVLTNIKNEIENEVATIKQLNDRYQWAALRRLIETHGLDTARVNHQFGRMLEQRGELVRIGSDPDYEALAKAALAQPIEPAPALAVYVARNGLNIENVLFDYFITVKKKQNRPRQSILKAAIRNKQEQIVDKLSNDVDEEELKQLVKANQTLGFYEQLLDSTVLCKQYDIKKILVEESSKTPEAPRLLNALVSQFDVTVSDQVEKMDNALVNIIDDRAREWLKTNCPGAWAAFSV